MKSSIVKVVFIALCYYLSGYSYYSSPTPSTHFSTRSTRLSPCNTRLSTRSTSLSTRSTRLSSHLSTRSARLSTRSIHLSTHSTRLAIRLSTRSLCSTICWSFYNWSLRTDAPLLFHLLSFSKTVQNFYFMFSSPYYVTYFASYLLITKFKEVCSYIKCNSNYMYQVYWK